MSSINECPFCGHKERWLHDNKLAYSILSDPRKVPGHFLVIPKRHIEEPWELKPEELQAIFEIIFKLQKIVTKTLAEGVDVRQNYRPFLKQDGIKVDHVHFHVLPRKYKDGIFEKAEKHETELFKPLTDKETSEILRLIS